MINTMKEMISSAHKLHWGIEQISRSIQGYLESDVDNFDLQYEDFGLDLVSVCCYDETDIHLVQDPAKKIWLIVDYTESGKSKVYHLTPKDTDFVDVEDWFDTFETLLIDSYL